MTHRVLQGLHLASLSSKLGCTSAAEIFITIVDEGFELCFFVGMIATSERLSQPLSIDCILRRAMISQGLASLRHIMIKHNPFRHLILFGTDKWFRHIFPGDRTISQMGYFISGMFYFCC